jgi:hypothetical protein
MTQKFGRVFLELTEASRAKLLKHFPPKFSEVFAKHISLEHGLLSDHEYRFKNVVVTGYQSTSYLDVLVVEVDGSCMRFSDKQVLHITLSAKPGIAPVCSNDVLSELLYQPCDLRLPLDVTLQTQYFN